MNRLEISLFGQFSVTLNGEPAPWYGGEATQGLLAYLVMHAGSECQRASLAALLWPDCAEETALQNLRQALRRLRQSIRDEEASPPFLLITRQAIAFNPASDYRVDVAVFQQAIAQSKEHLHHQLERCALCIRRLAEAVELYRGEFLAGLSLPSDLFEEWLVVEREGLHNQMLEALTALAAYHEARGGYIEAIRYAQRQVALEPWREEAHRQWMRALALSGQRAAALAQYEVCRRILEEELGVEPGEETVALYERIRKGLEEPPAMGVPAHNLPAQTTSFIGRHVQLAEIVEILIRPDVRLLTLTGPGGTGKTRLALQVAGELLDTFEDGVFFVGLASVQEPPLVVRAIADALGVQEAMEQLVAVPSPSYEFRGGAARGRPTSSSSMLARLREYLRDKALLLVLDNFEHILEAAPAVGELLAAAPGLKVLVTSRAPLQIYGEHEYVVPPMAVPDLGDLPSFAHLTEVEAMQLFVRRAQAAKVDFVLTDDNARAVAEICTKLDGLPLAIELAAARVKLLPPRSILPRLEHRLHFLTGGAVDLPSRQRTLRATMDWSHDLLTDAEKTLFRRLAVFLGGFSLEAAEAVGNLSLDGQRPLDVLSALEGLVDQSLLHQTSFDGEPRFVMLETIREYALERLEASGEGEAARECQARFYLALAEQAESQLYRYGVEQAAWADRLEMEQDNLRAALAWSIENAIEVGLRLAGALGRFWEACVKPGEGREWLDKALARSKGDTAELRALRARALAWAGVMARYQGDWAPSAAYFEESLTLWREVGDKRGLAHALLEMVPTIAGGDHQRAGLAIAQSVALYRELGDELGLSQALCRQGHITVSSDPQAARASLEESIALGRRIGALGPVATAIKGLGYIAMEQGDYAAARSFIEQCLRLGREAKDTIQVIYALGDLGAIAWMQGDYAQTARLLEEALELARKTQDKTQLAVALARLGTLSQDQGDFARARAYWESGLVILREIGNVEAVSTLLRKLGWIAYKEGDVEGARATLQESLAKAREAGIKREALYSLAILSLMSREQGDVDVAESYWQECLGLVRAIEDNRLATQVLRVMGREAHYWGHTDYAAAFLEETLTSAQKTGDEIEIAYSLSDLGGALGELGDNERARQCYEESLWIMRRAGRRREAAQLLAGLGVIAWLEGDDERAVGLYEESLAIAREVDDCRLIAKCLGSLGHVALHRGDIRQAEAHFDEGLRLAQEMGEPLAIASLLSGLGALARAEGRPERAARLFGATEALLAATKKRLPMADRAEHERNVVALRVQLEEKPLITAWAEGQALAREGGRQAIAYALSVQ